MDVCLNAPGGKGNLGTINLAEDVHSSSKLAFV